MRVLIDFTQIPLKRTGVGVYADGLVKNIAPRLSPADTLVVLVQKDETRLIEDLGEPAQIQFVSLPSVLFRNRALLLLFEQLLFPILLWMKKIDVIHSLHYTHPLLAPCARVVTIHDLTFLLYPQLHTRGRRWIMPFFIRRAIRHAEAIIFVSNATKTDAQKLFPATKRNLQAVIPLAVDSGKPTPPRDLQAATIEQLGITRPFLLFVGTIEPRKNVLRLIHAFEKIGSAHPDLLLVVVGKLGWDFSDVVAAIRSSVYSARIRLLGFVTQSQKEALFASCEALVYPSLYEGFGLPVLEAMAAGAPVITSNVSSLPEVAGNAALLINPCSIDEIAGAIENVLQDGRLRSELRLSGKRQAALFNWENMASQTLQVYTGLAPKSPSA